MSVSPGWRRGLRAAGLAVLGAVVLAALSLLGLTAYQLLFEVWPRYLFLYAPLFLVLALLGVEKMGERSKAMKS